MKQVVKNANVLEKQQQRIISNSFNNEVRSPRINSFKMLCSISLIVLLITSACAQSGKGSDVTANNSTVSKELVDTPTQGIQAAILSGNLDVVKQHIKAGTNLNEKDAMSGSTPIITAATFNKPEIVKALIDAKADLSITNNDGATALHTAAFFGRIDIVQMLIDANADRTIRNNFGATARESVMGDFEEVKPIYDMLKQQLAPLGLELDLNELEKARPVIAMMLQ